MGLQIKIPFVWGFWWVAGGYFVARQATTVSGFENDCSPEALFADEDLTEFGVGRYTHSSSVGKRDIVVGHSIFTILM